MFSSVSVVIGSVYDVLSKLTPEAAGFIALFTAGWVGMLNPITLTLAAIAAILLLINDYNTYENGGKSSFGDVWQQLDKSGVFDRLKTSIGDLVTHLDELFNIKGTTFTGSALGNFMEGFFNLLNDIVLMLDRLIETADKISTSTGIKTLLSRLGYEASNESSKNELGSVPGGVEGPAGISMQPINNTPPTGFAATTPDSPWYSKALSWLRKSIVPSMFWNDAPTATAQAAGNNISTLNRVSSPSFAQNINIYGATDPNATGNAVSSITSTAIIRGMQGVQQ
jgi:hypothetical protein